MTKHNPWKGDGTPHEADDDEVEAERVPTLNELEGRPIADQLAALTGSPVASLTVNEMHAFLNVARWYADRCEEVGVDRPPDVLRSLGCCAYEVLSYNAWLAEQGHPDAKAMGAPETRH